MKPEQEIVVCWMKRMMTNHDISAQQWAQRAEIAPTTLTRAMHEDYNGVTSLPVLHRLAKAIGESSPLDALRPGFAVVDEVLAPQMIDRLKQALRDS